jgi:dihydrolipoamide dehydrogenase
LPTLPASIGVIGAGPLGLELAQALARLGVEVMVFDDGKKLAALEDREIARILREILEKDFPIHSGVDVEATDASGGVKLRWTGESSGEHVFEKVLVAAGRAPRFDDLCLRNAGIPVDEHGMPTFDRHTMRCGDSAVFIAGDADHERAVLHDAANEGAIAGRNAAAFPRVESSHRTMPFSIMFTDPPLAMLGTTGPNGDARIVRGSAGFTDQGRAKITRRNTGVAHIYADAADGRIVGAILACPGGEHLAHLMAWAIERQQTAADLLALPIYHPTYEEGLKPALREICKAADAPVPPDRDDGSVPGT